MTILTSVQSVTVLLMVQLWTVMKMVIVFANTDLMAVNAISVQKDSQAINAMNANLLSLVKIVSNANQIISIIHCVKVCLIKISSNFIRKSKSYKYFLSQSVYVTLMVRLLWTVMKTMANAIAKRDLQE